MTDNTFTLSLRKSFGYRAGWAYMDEYQDIGEAHVDHYTDAAHENRDENDFSDDGDSRVTYKQVTVKAFKRVSRKKIMQALADSFSHSYCQHEYDCCGCRSYSARARHLWGDTYIVQISSSCNY